MLVIRMQRSGRKGHAMFRVVVQDARRTPTSGKVVAQLGSYNPHAKQLVLDKDKAQFYLDHGAQPSERAVRLFTSEGIKLPKWVTTPAPKQRTVKNADKRRSTRPEEPTVEEVPVETEATVEETETPQETETPAAAETAEETEAQPESEAVSETPEKESAEPEPAAETPSAEEEADEAKSE